MKNLELKAAAGDFDRARRALRTLGARRQPRILVQTDWYFLVPKGRLKLRQLGGRADAEVIFYLRPDASRARTSDYQKLVTGDAAHMLRLMRSMFTAGVCVRKRRELWLLHDTRIHLDEVDGLGRFVEIEVPFTGGVRQARQIMLRLVGGLEINRAQVLAGSYADMMVSTSGR